MVCGSPLFRELDVAGANALLATARKRRFPKQVSIAREGAPADFLHVVDEGLVMLCGSHDGAETAIEIVGPGSVLYLAAVMRNSVYLNSARTLTACRVLMIPAQDIRDHCERNNAIARAVINELAERRRCSVRQLKNIKLRSGAERLANWILRTGNIQGQDGWIELAYDKRTLASCLGMTPENLSRTLALLTKYGVRNSGPHIMIENASALAEFAKPNVLIDDWKHSVANGPTHRPL
jgi:CRP/FNR family transcriptional regulator, transcriptional activator FtrB